MLMIDLLWCWNSTYNVLMKIFFIVSSLSILHLIKRSYKTTHDEALDTFKIEYLFLVSIGAALLFNYELSLHEARIFLFMILTYSGFMVVYDLARESRYLTSTLYHS